MIVAFECPVCGSGEIKKSPAVVMPFVTFRIFGWKPVEIKPEHNLRSLDTGTSYQNCSSSFCRNCHFVFSDLRFDEVELARLYADYRGEEYIAQRQMFEPEYFTVNTYLEEPIKHLKEIEKFIGSVPFTFDNLLDWGGLDGKNTPFSQTEKDIFLYDLSDNKIAESAGGFTKLRNLRGYESHFDLITLMHVLEHVSDPVGFLANVSKYLSHQGVIYIEVPLEGIMDFETNHPSVIDTKRHWHEHLNFFSRRSLETLLEASGYSLLAIQRLDVSDDFRKFEIQQVIAQKNK